MGAFFILKPPSQRVDSLLMLISDCDNVSFPDFRPVEIGGKF